VSTSRIGHVTRNYRLLFGALAGVVLGLGIAGLALLIPGYSYVHQTVSEIGEIVSPARVPFAIMLGCVAACILIFASAVHDMSVAAHHSPLAAYFIGFMAVSVVGVAVFAYPHPLHSNFGLSECGWLPGALDIRNYLALRSAREDTRDGVMDRVRADVVCHRTQFDH
jgi:hypothetical protein